MRSGLVVVDKPAGWTSHDVVAKLRKCFGQKRVGHAGTLDPDATGVLLVGLGRVTRLLRFLQETEKEYRGAVMFGIATDTLDAAGKVLDERPMPVTLDAVTAAARAFVGDVEQVPPMVSALKVGGRRLHELARAGEDVPRAARPVRIGSIDVEGFVSGDHPVATLRVVCGSGTYIRSLAADLGTALGGSAHLASLRRLRVGAFSEADAAPLAEVETDPARALLTPAASMRGFDTVVVDDDLAAMARHGRSLPRADDTGHGAGSGPQAVLDRAGELLGVYEVRGDQLRPMVVVAEAGASGRG
jgi:tRNA pseudouridine55 synthase